MMAMIFEGGTISSSCYALDGPVGCVTEASWSVGYNSIRLAQNPKHFTGSHHGKDACPEIPSM
jgi:hypothetical protein